MSGYIITEDEKIKDIKKYKIESFDVLHKTNLNIFIIRHNEVLYKNDIITNACIYNHIQVLEWYKKSGYEIMNYEKSIYYTSGCGNVKVLKWFKKSNYKILCYAYYLEIACLNHKIEILKWFKTHSDFKYSFQAIYNTQKYNIFKFFLKNIHIKKIIKFSKQSFLKNIKFKTKNNYMKGYNKN
jgi:hypothetical protein